MALLDARCTFCGAALKVDGGLAPTKKTKAALICGLASCAAAPLAGVAGYASVEMYYAGGIADALAQAVAALAALLSASCIFLAIAGFVYSAAAGKESGARKSGFVAAGVIPSAFGLLLSMLATLMSIVLALDLFFNL